MSKSAHGSALPRTNAMRMLDAAKIQAGELIITPAPFDLTEMAARVLISFEKQINDKKLEMDVDLQDSLIVNGDSDHIYRVVYNLVDNAVEFVDEGGTLTILPDGDLFRADVRLNR